MPQLPSIWPTLLLIFLIIRDLYDHQRVTRHLPRHNTSLDDVILHHNDVIWSWPAFGASAATFVVDQIVPEHSQQGSSQGQYQGQPPPNGRGSDMMTRKDILSSRVSPLLLYPSTTHPPSEWHQFIIPDPPNSGGRTNTLDPPPNRDNNNHRLRLNTLKPPPASNEILLDLKSRAHDKSAVVYTKTQKSSKSSSHLDSATNDLSTGNRRYGSTVVRDGTRVEPGSV